MNSWIQCLTSKSILFQDYSNEKKTVNSRRKFRNLLIAIFLLIRSVIYTRQVFISENADPDLMSLWGANWHALGFGGRTLCIAAAAITAQSSLLRLLYWTKETNNKMYFLTQDFLGKSNFIREDKRREFDKQISIWLNVGLFVGNAATYICYLTITFLGFNIYLRKESAINALLWVTHTVIQFMTAYYAVFDSLTGIVFWFVCRTYVVLVIKEVIQEITDLTNGRNRIKSLSRKFTKFSHKYLLMQRTVSNFDDFSRYYLAIVTSTATVFNVGFLIAIMNTDHMWMKLLFANNFVFYSIKDIIVLIGATSIYSLGMKLHLGLNKFMSRSNHKLLLRDKTFLKNFIEETGDKKYPVISLTTATGNPHDISSFVSYIASYVSLFLVMYGFLHNVL